LIQDPVRNHRDHNDKDETALRGAKRVEQPEEHPA
jgi:hypothetical protein